MNVRFWLLAALFVLSHPAFARETISHGRFNDVTIYRPHGEVRELVLFFSGPHGWDPQIAPMAHALARQGALVAGIDTPAMFREFEKDDGDCVYPDGDLENLSHFLQAYYRLPSYRPAVLVGYDSGAALVYAMLAQAPKETFAGGISVGFCPLLQLHKPLCRSSNLKVASSRKSPDARLTPTSKLGVPWIAMQGTAGAACSVDATKFITSVKDAEHIALSGAPGNKDGADGDFHTWEPQFAAAYQRIAAQMAPPSVTRAELGDLPLVEVPVSSSTKNNSDTLALLISGDGGWAGIDKDLSAQLAKQGIPVVGLDSLRYFWRERTPQSLADDVDRILRFYSAEWNKHSVLLIGFSQGADVMAFAMNRLPPQTREQVDVLALLSPGTKAVFEFHLQNWLSGSSDGFPISPELLKVSGPPAICIYGEDDDESSCSTLVSPSWQVVKLPGGHHFDGRYDRLATLILQRRRR